MPNVKQLSIIFLVLMLIITLLTALSMEKQIKTLTIENAQLKAQVSYLLKW